jgi:hypothetical protein
MVANIRPSRLLRKIRKEQRDSEDYGPAAITRKQKPIVLAPKNPAAYALDVIDSWLNRSNDETGTQQQLPRTPIHVDLRVGLDFSRPLRQTKGPFYGRFGLATNCCSASKLGSAIQAGMGPHASRPPRSA